MTRDPIGNSIETYLMDRATVHVFPEEEALRKEKERRATLVVASQAVNVFDCAELLDMLGLDAGMGKRANQAS